MATLWQQAVAQDARYNAYRTPDNPQYRALYMRRRSHLLRENAASPERDVGVRRDYLKLRGQLLMERYGPVSLSDQGVFVSDKRDLSVELSLPARGSTIISLYSVRAGSVTSLARYPRSKGSEPRRLTVSRQPLADSSDTLYSAGGITPTASADASRAMAGNKTLAENYAFSGMHHIFDQHKNSVVAVKFANDDRSRIACCSYDGTISVMQLIPTPATVICLLQGHTGAVTDFAWSLSNDNIVSSSLDGTARLWSVSSASCIRVYASQKGSELLSICFQPLNNNLFAIGKGSGEIQILNVSTGKSPRGGVAKAAGRVLSLTYHPNGKLLWSADDKGFIFGFLSDPMTGKLMSKHKKIPVCPGHPITSISCRTWINREARDPCLLANCGTGAVLLFKVNSSDGNLALRRTFPIKQRGQLIRSAFCPLMSFSQGACIVTGSEDMNVYFFDIERDSKQCVNKLQGHSAPVLDVCFNYDESLLASCDANGIVIVWKRTEKANG